MCFYHILSPTPTSLRSSSPSYPPNFLFILESVLSVCLKQKKKSNQTYQMIKTKISKTKK